MWETTKMLSKNYPISHSSSHTIKKLFSYKTSFLHISFPRQCRVYCFNGTQARENSNVVDRDPQGPVLVLVGYQVSDPGGQKWPTNKEKKIKICVYFKVLMFSLRTGGLSCRLDVLHGTLGIKILQFLERKKWIFISAVKCYNFCHPIPGSESGSALS
jgi:hypothetical protein